MDHDTVLTVFVIIAAIALFIQAVVLVALFLVVRRVLTQILELARNYGEITTQTGQVVMDILTSSREPVKLIAANFAEISRIVRERAAALDVAIGAVAQRTRLQAERVDEMITGILEKIDSTMNIVHRSVLSPLQEISAVFKGLEAGFDFLFGRRTSRSRSETTQDEEMFI
jgi:hypothetical protein